MHLLLLTWTKRSLSLVLLSWTALRVQNLWVFDMITLLTPLPMGLEKEKLPHKFENYYFYLLFFVSYILGFASETFACPSVKMYVIPFLSTTSIIANDIIFFKYSQSVIVIQLKQQYDVTCLSKSYLTLNVYYKT